MVNAPVGVALPCVTPPDALQAPPTGEPALKRALRESKNGGGGGDGSGGSGLHCPGVDSVVTSAVQLWLVPRVTLPVQVAPAGALHAQSLHVRVSFTPVKYRDDAP